MSGEEPDRSIRTKFAARSIRVGAGWLWIVVCEGRGGVVVAKMESAYILISGCAAVAAKQYRVPG